MHYVTQRFFVKSMPVPPQHEKYYVAVLGPGCTRMRYVTHRSQRMQKHKFGVTCPGTLFMETDGDP
jgi:hypothetical protein